MKFISFFFYSLKGEKRKFIKNNPALKAKLPKNHKPEKNSVHIFTPEEIKCIFNRFKNSHTIYYSFLTAHYIELIG